MSASGQSHTKCVAGCCQIDTGTYRCVNCGAPYKAPLPWTTTTNRHVYSAQQEMFRQRAGKVQG